jgi:hypothetical protein
LPGQPGHRVDPPGQPGHTGFFLPPFFHQPGPVPAPGRPGPGSTRWAGPGFKTMFIWACILPSLACLGFSTLSSLKEFEFGARPIILELGNVIGLDTPPSLCSGHTHSFKYVRRRVIRVYIYIKQKNL